MTELPTSTHWAADPMVRKQIAEVFSQYNIIGGGNILRALDKIESGVTKLSQSRAQSLEEYLRWTHEALRGEPMAVICDSVSYQRGQTVVEDKIIFHTPIGNAEFDSLPRLLICVGRGYANANRIASLDRGNGDEQRIEALGMMVERRRRDGAEYLLVTSIYKTDRLDAILEGEEERK